MLKTIALRPRPTEAIYAPEAVQSPASPETPCASRSLSEILGTRGSNCVAAAKKTDQISFTGSTNLTLFFGLAGELFIV